MREPDTWPTPEQFVADWEALTPEQRLAQAERIINGVQQGARCFEMNHHHRIPDLEAEASRLRADRDVWQERAEIALREVELLGEAVGQLEAKAGHIDLWNTPTTSSGTFPKAKRDGNPLRGARKGD